MSGPTPEQFEEVAELQTSIDEGYVVAVLVPRGEVLVLMGDRAHGVELGRISKPACDSTGGPEGQLFKTFVMLMRAVALATFTSGGLEIEVEEVQANEKPN